MKIYTKRGDKGQTDLFGGMRVSKSDIRVKAYGLIDSTNSALGLALNKCEHISELREPLRFLMNLLFSLGSEVACAPKKSAQEMLNKHLKILVKDKHILYMENLIDSLEKSLPVLKNFILPGGSEQACLLHNARCQARITEIELVFLKERDPELRDEILRFFNRLSDLLFVMARFANFILNMKDEEWDKD